jgi:hypothetical protein
MNIHEPTPAPGLPVGGWLLQLGFIGAGARYASGELAPVAKDTATFLTDGKGLLGIGVSNSTSGGANSEVVPAVGPTGPDCRK